jgi:hypothetical protein
MGRVLARRCVTTAWVTLAITGVTKLVHSGEPARSMNDPVLRWLFDWLWKTRIR